MFFIESFCQNFTGIFENIQQKMFRVELLEWNWDRIYSF